MIKQKVKLGFSIAETLIALLIISLMMGIAAPIVVRNAAQNARDAQNKNWVVLPAHDDTGSVLMPLKNVNYEGKDITVSSLIVNGTVIVEKKSSNGGS